MTWATVAELRARFGTEFDSRADEDLSPALDAASLEIDSERPPRPVSAAGARVLKEKCLILARLHLYPDQALDDTHPVVREALGVRGWLKRLASGAVVLPSDQAEVAAESGAEWGSVPTVWGRGEGGGL